MVGTLANQNSASSVHKARKAHKAHKMHKAHKVHKACQVVGKNQDFMLMRLFNSIDLIGCGGDISQSESCKQCA